MLYSLVVQAHTVCKTSVSRALFVRLVPTVCQRSSSFLYGFLLVHMLKPVCSPSSQPVLNPPANSLGASCNFLIAEALDRRTGPQVRLQAIQWALHPAAALPKDVGVSHPRRNILMPKQFLDGADVRSPLQRGGRKAVTQSVGGRSRVDTAGCHSFIDRGFHQPARVEELRLAQPWPDQLQARHGHLGVM
jgi:hypothetical protein